jgi:hypothetical protein
MLLRSVSLLQLHGKGVITNSLRSSAERLWASMSAAAVLGVCGDAMGGLDSLGAGDGEDIVFGGKICGERLWMCIFL